MLLPALASCPCKVETVILHRCVEPLLHAIHSSKFSFRPHAPPSDTAQRPVLSWVSSKLPEHHTRRTQTSICRKHTICTCSETLDILPLRLLMFVLDTLTSCSKSTFFPDDEDMCSIQRCIFRQLACGLHCLGRARSAVPNSGFKLIAVCREVSNSNIVSRAVRHKTPLDR